MLAQGSIQSHNRILSNPSNVIPCNTQGNFNRVCQPGSLASGGNSRVVQSSQYQNAHMPQGTYVAGSSQQHNVSMQQGSFTGGITGGVCNNNRVNQPIPTSGKVVVRRPDGNTYVTTHTAYNQGQPSYPPQQQKPANCEKNSPGGTILSTKINPNH